MNAVNLLKRLALVLLLAVTAPAALAQSALRDFDHTRTGFALTGQHAKERCESCHLGGVFKGTPRDCASCHTAGTAWSRANVVKPQNHLSTTIQQDCDACHTTQTYTNTRFNHQGLAGQSCASCHNGSVLGAVGKPATAVHAGQTVCENCHKSTSNWNGAKPDHSSFTSATNCASCHNGSNASGKSATHIPSGAANCSTCHSTNGWKPSTFNHTQATVNGQCASCHNGAFPPADGRNPTHIPYQTLAGVSIANCDSCHKAGYKSWTPAKFHASVSVTGQCASCHTGGFSPAVGKPNTAIHAGASTCETCHKSTSDWSAANVDHATFTSATNCASCHNGSAATGKSATHIPSGASNCINCHTTKTWKPSSFNHTQGTMAGQCASCHSGAFPPADGRNPTHIPYQTLAGVVITNCDSCHKAGYAAWTPARFHGSVSVSNQCAGCHTGSYPPAVGKPNTTIHAGVTTCESCHKSTSDWGAAKVDHATFTSATNCSSCHNGSAATGKNASHVPVGAVNCINCHTTKTWKPSSFNHTQVVVASQCASCHSGAYPPADGRNPTHIPYQTLTGVAIVNCDSCHKAGYTAWTPARFHASVSVSTQCAACHTGSYPPAVGKPATAVHTGVTVCESCHKSASSWSNVVFGHSAANAVGTGTCDNCHNGTAAKGKQAGHIPVTTGPTKCDNCHRSQSSWSTSVTMNHTVVSASTCKSCHNGSYVSQGNQGALAKPANHIPETQLLNGGAMDCKACHTGTSSWTSITMNHNNSLGGGAGWCKGCHLSGTAYAGSMERKSLTHEKKSTAAIDCSESGCHRPLGTKGVTYREWD